MKKFLLLIGVIFFSNSLFSQTEYVTDRGFEGATVGTTSFIVPSGGGGNVGATLAGQWQLTFANGNCAGGCSSGTSQVVTNTKNSGNNALYINITKQTNRNDIRLFQVFPASPAIAAGKYLITYYMKADKANYPLVLDVLKPTQSLSVNGSVPYSVAHTTTTNWKKYRFIVDLTTWTAAELTNFRISIRPNTAINTASPTGPFPKEFWFDDFSFTPYNSATANIGSLADLKNIAILVAQERKKMSLDSGFVAESVALDAEIQLMSAGTFNVPIIPTKAVGFNPATALTTAATNPYINSVQNWADTYSSTTFVPYKKSKVGKSIFPKTSSQICRDLAPTIERLYWLVTSPYSSYRYNPDLFYRFLHIMYATSDDYKLNGNESVAGNLPGSTDNGMNDWLGAYGFPYGWRMLEYTYPDYVPITLKKQMQDATDLMGTQHRIWANNVYDYPYINRDISYAEVLMHAGLYRNNSDWTNIAKVLIDTTKAHLYPDGAYAYIGYQNEVQNYHGATNNSMAKLWAVSEYQSAWDCLQTGSNYEVISIEGGSVPEFYTAGCWKTQWNGIAGESGVGLVSVSENPYLKTRLDQLDAIFGISPEAFGIGYYKDIVGKPIADNYVVYDRNIQGPRGRYGRFSYGISARITSPEATTRVPGVGMQTMVGAMMTQVGRNVNQDEMNAAVMAVHSKVHVKNSSTPAEWIDWAYMSNKTEPLICVAKTASTVSSPAVLQSQSYGPSAYDTQWSSYQQWITLPDRIIGFVETYPGSNVPTNAFEIDGRVRFTYGRNGLKTAKNLVEDIAGQKYSYGNLKTIIHAHDFTTVSTGLAGTLRDDQSTGPASEIIFRYNLSTGTTLYPYPGTTKKYFIVEIRRSDAVGDAVVSRVIDGETKGLVVKLNGKSYSSFRNLGTAPATIDLTNVLIAGSINEAHFPRNDEPSLIKPQKITGTNFSLSGKNQVLIISSNEPTDIGKGWRNYDQTLRSNGVFQPDCNNCDN
jgi:hypothetical protein